MAQQFYEAPRAAAAQQAGASPASTAAPLVSQPSPIASPPPGPAQDDQLRAELAETRSRLQQESQARQAAEQRAHLAQSQVQKLEQELQQTAARELSLKEQLKSTNETARANLRKAEEHATGLERRLKDAEECIARLQAATAVAPSPPPQPTSVETQLFFEKELQQAAAREVGLQEQLKQLTATSEAARADVRKAEDRATDLERRLRDAEECNARLRLAAAPPQLPTTQQTTVETQLFMEKAKAAFHASLTNVYSGLYFAVTGIDRADPSPEYQGRHRAAVARILARDDLEPRERHRRIVYHTTPNPSAMAAIPREGMRPSNCPICSTGVDNCGDPGWFGDHTKGVYVSKHADYTTYYQHHRPPTKGDSGSIIAFELVTGKTKHMLQRVDGCAPTAGHLCHESPNHLEYFVFDPSQLLPLFVVHWTAVQSRCNMPHDQ
eukprot:TRINITY_DN7289_c0_g1_i17.p1 TRINITY_DN7289_c0_g1~~TRINITY_DN7289_c0_g1_i17.p1  ORF type:complete len:438 (+),score=89.12 TRINITY_DN7289_c0_g1_i17:94-1407(+)